MAHAIWGDRAAYTGDRTDVWHGIGVYVGDRNFESAEEVLKLAQMDIEYSMRPAFFHVDDSQGSQLFPIPNFYAITRPGFGTEDREVPVGRATGSYRILQPREAFIPFDPLVKAGLAKYSAAGMLHDGARMWIAAKVGDGVVRETKEGQPDTVEMYLMLYAGFTGSTAITANVSKIRSVCANTVQAAVDSGSNVSIVHNGAMFGNLEAAKETLGQMSAEFGKSMESYRAMAAKKVTVKQVAKLFDETFILETDEKPSKLRTNQIERITRLMLNGAGNGQGTVWDWFNGVTEYMDHEGKGGRMANVESSWFGTRGQHRAKAMAAALKMVA